LAHRRGAAGAVGAGRPTTKARTSASACRDVEPSPIGSVKNKEGERDQTKDGSYRPKALSPALMAVRDRLGAERRMTLARIEATTIDFDGIVAAASGANIDDEHDPEGSTIAYERAQVGALLREERAYLDDLDRALARLDAGLYSTCERCGALIGSERLAARPAARTCIDCALSSRPDPGLG
jgi:DnaK suppressor protein